MFNLASGVSVPFPEKLKEGFQRKDNSLICNISFEKLKPILEEFYHGLDQPLFLALHVPLNQRRKIEGRGSGRDS